MELTITVSDSNKVALEKRARERGYQDITKFVERLITTDLLAAQSFDEILAPIRQVFQETNISEERLDALFEEVRQEVYEEPKRKRE
jgi:rubrerythrin